MHPRRLPKAKITIFETGTEHDVDQGREMQGHDRSHPRQGVQKPLQRGATKVDHLLDQAHRARQQTPSLRGQVGRNQERNQNEDFPERREPRWGIKHEQRQREPQRQGI